MSVYNRLVKEFDAIEKAKAITRALDHQVRLDILCLLSEKVGLTVTEIYQTLRMEQSVVSQHLAELRKVDIVLTRREGKHVLYAINDGVLYKIIGAFCELDGICEPTGGNIPVTDTMRKNPDELRLHGGPGGEGEGEQQASADTQAPAPETTTEKGSE